MGADHGRLEGRRGFLPFLEHNGDDVVPDVALPFHLEVSTHKVTEKVARTRHGVTKLAQDDQPQRSEPELQASLIPCLPHFTS